MVNKHKSGQPVELNIFQRIAFSDLDTYRKCQRFLQKHGYVQAINQHDLADLLGIAVHEGGEGIVPEFLSLHPDADCFKNQKLSKEELVEQLNACGCSMVLGADGEIKELKSDDKPAALPTAAKEQAQPHEVSHPKFVMAEHMPIIFITGVICVTIAAIALNKN